METNIFNEDMISRFVQEKLHEVVHSGIKKYSKNWNFRCPCCGDSKKRKRLMRGYYYPATNSYKCWNEDTCQSSGLWIISKLSHKDINLVRRDYIDWSRRYKGERTAVEEPDKAKEETGPIKVKDCWLDLNEDAKKMLTTRKIFEAPYAPKNWQLYYNFKSKRVVIPWLEHGEIKYYQERALYKGQEPKYLFPYGMEKYIFGIETIDDSFPYIFCLEGCFDSIFVLNGVAIGGLTPTDKQIDLLDTMFCDKVIFTDNFWLDEASRQKILRLKNNCKVFMWPKEVKEKDVNDYIIVNETNPFIDRNFLQDHVVSLTKAQVMIRLNSGN